MRIIAGTLKGRRLASPTWDGLRPTSDRLRETIFNVLGPSVVDARVLDVCAGTGAIAIEALSRGASRATCLESDARAVALIRANAAAVGLEKRCIIVRGQAPGGLTPAGLDGPYDLVVLDPPYDAPWIADAVAASAALVEGDGRIVLEHAARVTAPDVPGLVRERTRRAGDSALTTYRPGVNGERGDTEG
ncbi:MAG: 16S rRNA (guanine(966)-N(2))-methyltransferase RsmD [Vicinamibacterales bacterium]